MHVRARPHRGSVVAAPCMRATVAQLVTLIDVRCQLIVACADKTLTAATVAYLDGVGVALQLDAALAAVPLAGLRSAAAVGAEHRARKGAAAGKDAEGERAARNPHFDGERRLDPLPLHFRWQLAGASPAAAATGDAARSGAPRASAPRAPRALLAVARVRATSLFCAKPAEVSVLLFSVTFYANLAHNLTRSPSHI